MDMREWLERFDHRPEDFEEAAVCETCGRSLEAEETCAACGDGEGEAA